ncbi:hypothetical protein SRB5_04610 [Streptomyces sp. RB5]|uniref:HEAT repeat domain-containing protein n=2 Tax=Streptomyces smaragdinus TaxID=2585196 RepID=A0A7K0CC65_9ACTN|nr:hypothetical protein [Streptomyces smaragdinus]
MSRLLTETDWSELDHAYGPASDAPFHLLALLGADITNRSAAVAYLDSAVLHQGSIYSATGPIARVVASVLRDPRTAELVENVLPRDVEPRPLRLDLVDFLARVAESCAFDVVDEPMLLAEAHPARYDEAELEGMRAEVKAWRRDMTGDDTTQSSDRLPAAVLDDEFARAMSARDMLACRAFAPELLNGLTAVFDDPDGRVKTKALEAAVHLSGHQNLVMNRPEIEHRLTEAAVSCSEPGVRAAAARLLGILGAHPEALLHDAHPGVRACAALAPSLAGDPFANRAILDALLTPHEADHWFEGHLPGQDGWLRFDLIRAAALGVDDFEDLLPAALAVLALASVHTLDEDLCPFVTAAFPRLHRAGDVLPPAQRAYLSALLDREELWRAASVQPWFRRTGLPQDLGACRTLVEISEGA